jgi:isocitrate dehydrogenase
MLDFLLFISIKSKTKSPMPQAHMGNNMRSLLIAIRNTFGITVSVAIPSPIAIKKNSPFVIA